MEAKHRALKEKHKKHKKQSRKTRMLMFNEKHVLTCCGVTVPETFFEPSNYYSDN